ncbi:MAG: rod shape-determining protein MreC [Candidatus Daviesbacteria bacterium]|nr:rod shape-determining protein MreC [Candidatus Daviesbacteria bacterium]
MIKSTPHLQLFLILVLFSLVILLLDSFRLFAIPQRMVSFVTNPISFGIYRSYQNIDRQFYFIFSAREAGQQNLALKEQIGQLLSENASLRKELAESKALLTQQESIDRRTYNLLPARPIGLGRYLKIDQGLNAGLNLGQPVIFKDNYIGKIIQINQNSSNIELLSDPDSKVAAFTQSLEGKAKGVLLGQFGTELILDKILHEEPVKIGDLVYSEGTESFIPRGLILGQVTQILENENEVFKQAKVKYVFDIGDLELVFVINQ